MQFAHLARVESSATLTINSLVLKKKAAGERVYNLNAGEPIMPAPEAVIEAVLKAMREGKTQYPPVAGIPELRSAAVEWMNLKSQTEYRLEQCLITCGGKFGLYALFQALLNPGDEVLLAAPYWVSYPSLVRIFGGLPKIVSTMETSGWKVTVNALEKLVSPRTKIVIINNATNPTGALYNRSELKDILAFAEAHDLLVISDEVYSGLVYDNNEFISSGSFTEYQDRVVVVESCSKHFAMTGWRVGLGFGPKEIIDILTTIQSQSTSGTASISQWAALAAFRQAEVLASNLRAEMQRRRNALVNALASAFQPAPPSPPASLYLFVSLKALGVDEQNSAVFCERLLDQAGVALAPGAAFGQDGYVRFSFGDTIHNLEAGARALYTFLRK